MIDFHSEPMLSTAQRFFEERSLTISSVEPKPALSPPVQGLAGVGIDPTCPYPPVDVSQVTVHEVRQSETLQGMFVLLFHIFSAPSTGTRSLISHGTVLVIWYRTKNGTSYSNTSTKNRKARLEPSTGYRLLVLTTGSMYQLLVTGTGYRLLVPDTSND